MSAARTLVFVGAHPDDESFGMGGTLAQYAAAGVKVYCVCGTRGEVGEVAPEFMKGFETIADLRTHEMECAAEALGLAGVIYLGYRDSGMAGTEDNRHPNALAAAPPEEVAGRIVEIFRRLKPQVVVTFDPIGGYHHPDHVAMHQAAVQAFHASADPRKYPEAGPPFQPQRLYFLVFPHRFMMKTMVRLMVLFGRDIHHFGKNRDIDLADFMEADFPVHAVVRLKKESVLAGERASACHASQLFEDSPRSGLLGLLDKLLGRKDYFMRAEPPVKGRRKERDFFEEVV